MTTSTIFRDGDEVEITVYDSAGVPIERVYGVDGQPRDELPQDLTPFMDEVEWMPPGFKIP